MAIVQPSDFAEANSRFLIPNITAGPGTFVAFIDEREAYILGVVFGSKFYKDFVDGLAALPVKWLPNITYSIGTQVSYGVSVWAAIAENNNAAPVEGASWTKVADNKWLKLREGYSYSNNEKPYSYTGLKNILKPYILSEYVKKFHTNIAKLGVNQPKVANSEVLNPMQIIVSNYNEFVRLLGKSYYGYNLVDTFYGFYWINREDYPDMRFDDECQIMPINSFGL